LENSDAPQSLLDYYFYAEAMRIYSNFLATILVSDYADPLLARNPVV